MIHAADVWKNGKMLRQGLPPVHLEPERVLVDLHVRRVAVLPEELAAGRLRQAAQRRLVELLADLSVEVDVRLGLDQEARGALHDDLALADGAVGDQAHALSGELLLVERRRLHNLGAGRDREVCRQVGVSGRRDDDYAVADFLIPKHALVPLDAVLRSLPRRWQLVLVELVRRLEQVAVFGVVWFI